MQIFTRRRPRKRWIALGCGAVALAALYAANASWAADPKGALQILAHRGPHQRFETKGLTDETCTAARSLPITHDYLENTVRSIGAAFELGADMVEFDIHPTTDGEFAVFHDWTIDCRTQGKGVTRQHSMAYLRTLDIAYGYTADGGKTYPLRGKGVGLMPIFAEVLRAFPDRAFMVNIKSNDPKEADQIDGYLRSQGLSDTHLYFFGGVRPATRLRELRPGAHVAFRDQSMDCMKGYLLWGWNGHVPKACEGATVVVPIGWRRLFWGWPNRFLERMQTAGAHVWLAGDVDWERKAPRGVDTLQDVARIPKGWKGGVMTDRIEVVGPALKPKERGAGVGAPR